MIQHFFLGFLSGVIVMLGWKPFLKYVRESRKQENKA